MLRRLGGCFLGLIRSDYSLVTGIFCPVGSVIDGLDGLPKDLPISRCLKGFRLGA